MLKYLLLIFAGLSFSSAAAARVSCSDFSTQREAQAYYYSNNAYWLDRDQDGEACECLYGGSRYGSSICYRR